MKLVIGLGNPGLKYENTYHNMGFKAVKKAAELLNTRFNCTECKAKTATLYINGEKIVLALPQTYMNLSGDSVKELMGKYKVAAEDTVIVYDDVDLPTGTLRLREGGSGGTHNGMKNIIERAGTNAFKRIRLGIGGDRGELALADFVLMKVKKESRQAAEDMQKRAAEALTEYIRTADFQKIMRAYNAKAECTD